MTQDAQSLLAQAASHEQKGDRNAAMRLYEQVASGDSAHAACARTSAQRLRELEAAEKPSAPDGARGGIGGLIKFLGIGLAAVLALGRAGLKHGGHAGDAVRHLAREGGEFPHAGNRLDRLNRLLSDPLDPHVPHTVNELDRHDIKNFDDLLSVLSEAKRHKVDAMALERPVETPLRATSSEGEFRPQRAVEVREVDAKGLASDLLDAATESNGVSPHRRIREVHLVNHSCRTEYSGPIDGDMNAVKHDSDEEATWYLSGVMVEHTRKTYTELPQAELGEFDRCRLRFGDDGRVFLSLHERVRVGTRDFEHRDNYELGFVQGSKVEYDSGKTVRLIFTPEAIRRQRQNLEERAREIARTLAAEESWTDIPKGSQINVQIKEFPESSVIAATRSSLVIQDLGKMVMQAIITAAPP